MRAWRSLAPAQHWIRPFIVLVLLLIGHFDTAAVQATGKQLHVNVPHAVFDRPQLLTEVPVVVAESELEVVVDLQLVVVEQVVDVRARALVLRLELLEV